MPRSVILFVRAPRLGAVKRRLGRDVGPLPAWRFYRTAAGRVLRHLTRDPRWACRLAVTPDRFRTPRAAWPGLGRFSRVPQGHGDLGLRMARALVDAPPGPRVLVGSDIPEIDASAVDRAFAALGLADAVFGPAPDGGFWLIGLSGRRPLPRLRPLAGIRWSSPHALADTRAALPTGWTVALLDPLEDVDDGASYRRWLERRRRPGRR